jgi:hypothetical protein
MSAIEHCPEGCARITAARLTLLGGELAATKAEKRLIVEMVSRERERLRVAVEALRDIAEADPVDMALDPGWAARIARAALAREE